MKALKPIEILEQIFSETINVKTISVETQAVGLQTAKRICSEKNFDVHLVKKRGSNELMLFRKEDQSVRPLNVNDVISNSTPVLDVLQLLQEQAYLFVMEKQKITRIVTRADLNSIPVRIFLFGMISLFEQQLRDFIEIEIPDWADDLGHYNLNGAKKRFEKKIKNNEEVSLTECLFFSDLLVIVRKNWRVFFGMIEGFDKGETTDIIKSLIKFRNELAHSQEFTFSFKEISELISFVGFMLKKL